MSERYVRVERRRLTGTQHEGVQMWAIEGLPRTEQTHEVVLVKTAPPCLYVSQLDKSRLIRIELDQDYKLTEKVQVWTIGPELSEVHDLDSSRLQQDPALCELHNISESKIFKTKDGSPKLWLSLQTPNLLLLVDPYEPFDEKSELPEHVVPLPKWMPVEGQLKKGDFARVALTSGNQRHMVGNVAELISDICNGLVTVAFAADSTKISVARAHLQKVKWIGGPHACREDANKNGIWITMKGTDPSTTASKDYGAACLCCQEEFHTENVLTTQILPPDFQKQQGWAIVRFELPTMEWSKTHPIWRYAQDESTIYQCKRSPPMCDFFSNGHVVCSQDLQTRYMVIDPSRSASTTLEDHKMQISIPLDGRPQHSKGPLGVGVVASPDRKHIFMAMLGLDASLLQCKESSPTAGIMHSFPNLCVGKGEDHLRFIHVAFGQAARQRIYALSSSLLPDAHRPDDQGDSICDAIVAFDFGADYTAIKKVGVLPLGCKSKAHRICCERNPRGDDVLFVTEFTESRVVQITNANRLDMVEVSTDIADLHYYERSDGL